MSDETAWVEPMDDRLFEITRQLIRYAASRGEPMRITVDAYGVDVESGEFIKTRSRAGAIDAAPHHVSTD